MSSPPDAPTKLTFGKLLAIVVLQFVAMATTGIWRRGQHPKPHGVLRATFEVLANIPDKYKVGLFAKPGRYDALIRFSNGPQKEDREQGPQGMAIKLLGVQGDKILRAEEKATTHDFILIDGPVFFVRNVDSYLKLFLEMVRRFGGKPTNWEAWVKSKHPEDMPVIEHYHDRVVDSPLTREFSSQVPYAFGLGDTTICRYFTIPGPNNMTALFPPQYRDKDFLRRVITDQVTTSARPATFDFCVQLLTDATPEIIENPTAEWDTFKQPVATITIPAQVFDRPEQERFGELLSYTPWHALPEHRPVGQINQIRRWVYAATSRLRHFVRLAPRREPTSVLPPVDPGRPLRRWAEVVAAALIAGGVVTGLDMLRSMLHVPVPHYAAPERSVWLRQNWDPAGREWYRHASQGGQFPPMISVPYEWFLALERPYVGLGDVGALSDQTYLNRFGFIPSSTEDGAYDWRSCKETHVVKAYGEKPDYRTGPAVGANRHRLPVGFACTDRDADPMLLPDGRPWPNPSTGETMTGIGLTCAACHTGRLTYKGTQLLVDGGSAMTDIVKLNQAIAVSLLLTHFDPWRFDRFAERVLGPDPTGDARNALEAQLKSVVQRAGALRDLDAKVKPQSVEEGFGRLDALTRIGNQVFAIHVGQPENYAGSAAPVHYPRIWDVPWFPWAQYSASIQQPMVRNAGEALGTGASIATAGAPLASPSLTAPLDTSTVRIRTLYEMEMMLAGWTQPTAEQKFTGLHAPKWPREIFGEPKPELVEHGAKLYADICQHCHLPPKGSKAFWDHWMDPTSNAGAERYLKINEIPVSEVGTDRKYLDTVADRKLKLPPSLGLKDDRFLFALRDIVGRTTKFWYDREKMSQADRQKMNAWRPNEVKADPVYKARPLDGVWATPPYLHNGSVPTIALLLGPVEQRPKTFWLGHREYDPDTLGYEYERELPGGFKFKTAKAGNHNTGHAFDESFKKPDQKPGVIGPKLSEQDIKALIEFLKSM